MDVGLPKFPRCLGFLFTEELGTKRSRGLKRLLSML